MLTGVSCVSPGFRPWFGLSVVNPGVVAWYFDCCEDKEYYGVGAFPCGLELSFSGLIFSNLN